MAIFLLLCKEQGLGTRSIDGHMATVVAKTRRLCIPQMNHFSLYSPKCVEGEFSEVLAYLFWACFEGRIWAN
jgi:hypothetical protein